MMHLSHSDWLTIDMLRCYLPSESLAHFDNLTFLSKKITGFTTITCVVRISWKNEINKLTVLNDLKNLHLLQIMVQ